MVVSQIACKCGFGLKRVASNAHWVQIIVCVTIMRLPADTYAKCGSQCPLVKETIGRDDWGDGREKV